MSVLLNMDETSLQGIPIIILFKHHCFVPHWLIWFCSYLYYIWKCLFFYGMAALFPWRFINQVFCKPAWNFLHRSCFVFTISWASIDALLKLRKYNRPMLRWTSFSIRLICFEEFLHYYNDFMFASLNLRIYWRLDVIDWLIHSNL